MNKMRSVLCGLVAAAGLLGPVAGAAAQAGVSVSKQGVCAVTDGWVRSTSVYDRTVAGVVSNTWELGGTALCEGTEQGAYSVYLIGSGTQVYADGTTYPSNGLPVAEQAFVSGNIGPYSAAVTVALTGPHMTFEGRGTSGLREFGGNGVLTNWTNPVYGQVWGQQFNQYYGWAGTITINDVD